MSAIDEAILYNTTGLHIGGEDTNSDRNPDLWGFSMHAEHHPLLRLDRHAGGGTRVGSRVLGSPMMVETGPEALDSCLTPAAAFCEREMHS